MHKLMYMDFLFIVKSHTFIPNYVTFTVNKTQKHECKIFYCFNPYYVTNGYFNPSSDNIFIILRCTLSI